MLEIVFLILKIAGIIFVSVLGILIVVVCFALFVPVRYRGDFSAADTDVSEKKAVSAKFRATWLLYLVRVYISYEETARVRVKLLFFTLMDTAKEKKAKRRKKEREKKEDRTEEDAESTPKEDAESTPEEKEENTESAPEENTESIPEEKRENGAEQQESEDDGTDEKERRPKKEKKNIKTIISNILQTIRDFCDKLKGIKEKAEKIEELWISDHMAKSRSLLGRQLACLLRHTKPKKLEGYIRFGFDDPSTTGYAMAVYGILYPIWSPKLDLYPDFEKQVLDCHILIKGKIRVWHFVRAALRLILSKDVRRVIKDIRKF